MVSARLQRGLGILGVAAVCLVAAALAWRKPQFEGRSINEWFDLAASDLKQMAPCARAFEHFGDTGIDFLVQKVAYEPPFWSRGYSRLRLELSRRLGLAPYAPPNVPLIRDRAGRLLGYAEGDAVVPLLRLLDRSSGEVRMSALRALAQLGPAARNTAGPTLLELLNDSEAGVVYEAITALGTSQYAPDRAVPRLLPFLQHTNNRVRVEVSYTLGSYPAMAEVTYAALHASLEDADEVVRANAARALGRMRRSAQPSSARLRRQMRDARDGSPPSSQALLPRIRAAEALVLIEGVAPADAITDFERVLTEAESGRDPYCSLMAQVTRLRLGREPPELVATCTALLSSHSNWHAWEAVEAMAERGVWDDSAVTFFGAAARHPSAVVREKAQAELRLRRGAEPK